MAAHAPAAPAKVFREPAQTGSVQCPCCGAPITLRGFGGVQQVACQYCGSELAPEDSGELQVLKQVQRQQRQSMIPLYSRGTLDGAEWEVIGIVWRECNVDGITYPWQEFLLFNPYKGYRWLIYQMSDGHWTIGGPLKGAPKANIAAAHKSIEYGKERYRHFQTVMATVSYVEGEFPWQVHLGDHAVAHEYILPPKTLSIEESQMPDGSADVNFTGMEHITGAEVWKAFKLQGSPPSTSGVGACVPNPYRQGAKVFWLTFAALLLALIGTSVIYIGGRTNKVVFQKSDLGSEPFTQEIQIGEKGEKTTVEFKFSAAGLDNQWAYVDVMLVNTDREEGIGFGATAESWHGVSGGESWREGKPSQTVVIGGVEGGSYLLQITPSSGHQAQPGAPLPVSKPGEPPKTPPPPKLNVELRENVVLLRYVLFAFFVVITFPIINAMLGLFFEGRRWQNSDYAPG